MLNSKDITIAQDIIKGLTTPENFGSDECCFIENDYTLNYDEAEYGPSYADSGATKAALIMENQSFVIKIPFDGEWSNSDEYDGYDEDDEYNENIPRKFTEFTGAITEENPASWNYCQMEYELATKMCENGFAEIAPSTAFIGFDTTGRPCYIQEKLISFGNIDKEVVCSEASRSKVEQMSEKYTICPAEWVGCVLDKYGNDYWERFIDWCEANCDYAIDDMHWNNFGYREDGSPCFLDLGGFHH